MDSSHENICVLSPQHEKLNKAMHARGVSLISRLQPACLHAYMIASQTCDEHCFLSISFSGKSASRLSVNFFDSDCPGFPLLEGGHGSARLFTPSDQDREVLPMRTML